MIPKVIHYCWFGGNPLPRGIEKCIESWKKFCPDYEIRRWDESNYDVNANPFVREAYARKSWAFVSDYARLDIVCRNGGIYMDTDVELKQSLDPLLDQGCYFAVQKVGNCINTGLGFGSEAEHPALKAMLAQYEGVEYSDEIKAEIACPILNTRALAPEGLPETEKVMTLLGAKVYPPRYFDPFSPGDDRNLLCPDTISVHHYSASWMSKGTQWKRALLRFIGQDRVNRLKKLLKRS